jgi:choline-glycine betaine transporter
VDLRPRPGPTQLLVAFYLAAAFVCFVTSADSNTSAMASIRSRGVTPENPAGALATKIA